MWDGYQLIREVEYTAPWDSLVIQGCVCDLGWHGYDCSLRDCPRGDNFLTTGQKNEKMRLQCNATAGSFYLTFRQYSTEPIPYNAGWAFLEHALEDLPGVRDVAVSIGNGYSVCAANNPTTTIEFLEDFGDLPPAKLVGVDLAGAARMVTEQALTCANCTAAGGCTGGVFLRYDNETTGLLRPGATADEVRAALAGLASIGGAASDFGAIEVAVNMTAHNVSSGLGAAAASLCTNDYDVRTTIHLYAQYGNLHDLSVVSSLYHNGALHDLEVDNPTGTKENDWCSGFGWCNTTHAHCECYMNVSSSITSVSTYINETYNATVAWFNGQNWTYNTSEAIRAVAVPTELYWDNRYGSSDGYGNYGDRGDCGYRMIEPTGCPGVLDAEAEAFYPCNSQGTCDEDTYTCTCYAGWLGPDCTKQGCPTGKAWFAEPHAPQEAHLAEAECSNMGVCDYDTGVCKCRSGFTGRACERMACEAQCNGFGTCQPLWRLAELAVDAVSGEPLSGVTYGSTDPNYANRAQTWDYDMIQQCHCDTNSYLAPYNGPRFFLDGVYVDNPHLGGRRGWDCGRRYCPYGDDPMTAGAWEVQTVNCTLGGGNFMLGFRGETTAPISANATAAEVRAALENITTLGNVSVALSAGNSSCNVQDGAGFRVTFLKELGDVPLLVATKDSADPGYLGVNETVKGTKEFAECSNRGDCDYATGTCQCMHPFAFSDGDGQVGILDNCGRKDKLFDSS